MQFPLLFPSAWQKALARLRDLFTPQPVWRDITLETQLAAAIERALHDPEFRLQLFAHPKLTLARIDIQIPPQQAVTVLASTSTQTYFVLPILTEQEIAYLQAGVNSHHPRRAIRSQIILKTHRDPEYKANLLAHPSQVLIAEGFNLPQSVNIKVLANSPEHLYMVIPTSH